MEIVLVFIALAFGMIVGWFIRGYNEHKQRKETVKDVRPRERFTFTE